MATPERISVPVLEDDGSDVVLFDLHPPDGSGLEVLHEISSQALPAAANRLQRVLPGPAAFVLLEPPILPGLVQEREKSGRAEIRLWAAGCAAGQEG